MSNKSDNHIHALSRIKFWMLNMTISGVRKWKLVKLLGWSYFLKFKRLVVYILGFWGWTFIKFYLVPKNFSTQ